jgi:chemotaxis protein methyltransferase CheR
MYLKYGYDYKEYAEAHIKRRVLHFQNMKGYQRVIDIIGDIIYDKNIFSELVQALSINVTQMFRDPAFYQGLREKIIPELASNNFIRIWNAGCASGEEVYSVSILLDEFDCLNKVQIYATDINDNILEKAEKGIFDSSQLDLFKRNYHKSGGKKDFNKYFITHDEYALINQKI